MISDALVAFSAKIHRWWHVQTPRPQDLIFDARPADPPRVGQVFVHLSVRTPYISGGFPRAYPACTADSTPNVVST